METSASFSSYYQIIAPFTVLSSRYRLMLLSFQFSILFNTALLWGPALCSLVDKSVSRTSSRSLSRGTLELPGPPFCHPQSTADIRNRQKNHALPEPCKEDTGPREREQKKTSSLLAKRKKGSYPMQSSHSIWEKHADIYLSWSSQPTYLSCTGFKGELYLRWCLALLIGHSTGSELTAR